MGIVQKIKNKISSDGWDMSSKEAREKQVKQDFELSKIFKASQTQKMQELDDYYNNKHYNQEQIQIWLNSHNVDFIPPCLTDPFIQVESQIDPEVPSFQFSGREDLDKVKAKQREDVVEFVCYNNKIEDMNPENERNNNKFGNALWKVSFDKDKKGPGFIGDIVIGNPSPANIFPDPAANDIEDCEYIVYAYRIHRRKARRKFGKVIDTISNDANHADTEIFTRNTDGSSTNTNDDTIQIVEYWYKDLDGDIACSVQANNTEVQFIAKYWENTKDSGNQSYPFVKYCRTPVDKSFWDKGEIETIMDLVDAGDKEFLAALLNDNFCGNDIIIMEEETMANGSQPNNIPGAIWKTKQNKSAGIRRLGGISNNTNALQMIEFIHRKIQETNGNFDTNMGQEPSRVTTVGGIAQLNERADKRTSIKKADRNTGFRRLFELIDWSVLEFYNTNRMIMIKNPNQTSADKKDRIPVPFNSSTMRVYDDYTGYYYPRIDCEINVGEGIKHSKAFTLAATDQLSKTQITPANAEIVKSEIDIMDLPNKDIIKSSIDNSVQMMMPQPMMQGIPQGTPQNIPQDIPQEPDPEQVLTEMLDSMAPEQRQVFFSSPKEQQMQIIQQYMGGGEGD